MRDHQPLRSFRMGSWNQTCGVTQLPIIHGDAVRVFTLADNGCYPPRIPDEEDYSNSCYSNSYYTPVFLPFSGLYDDYGWVEDIVENENTKYLIARVTERTSLECNAFDKFDDYFQRGNKRFKTHRGMTRIRFMMVHEAVYQAMINAPASDHYGYRKTPEPSSFYVEEARKLLALHKTNEEKGYFRLNLAEYDPDNIVFRALERIDGPGHYESFIKEYSRFDYLSTLSGDGFEEIITLLSDFMKFSVSMDVLRKSYFPQGHAGSQSGYEKLHDIMIDTMIKLRADDKNRYGEYDEDEEDEEEVTA